MIANVFSTMQMKTHQEGNRCMNLSMQMLLDIFDVDLFVFSKTVISRASEIALFTSVAALEIVLGKMVIVPDKVELLIPARFVQARYLKALAKSARGHVAVRPHAWRADRLTFFSRLLAELRATELRELLMQHGIEPAHAMCMCFVCA